MLRQVEDGKLIGNMALVENIQREKLRRHGKKFAFGLSNDLIEEVWPLTSRSKLADRVERNGGPR